MTTKLTAVVLLSVSAHAEPINNPHFYEIRKGTEVHFLLGTRHLGVRWEDFPETVKNAFASSKIVLLETQYSDSLRDGLSFSTDSMVPASNNLSEAHKEKLKKLGISEKLFPASAEEPCSMLLSYPFVGKYPFYLLDADIFFRAKDGKKSLIHLDSPEILEKAGSIDRAPSQACTVGMMLDNLSVEAILKIGGEGISQYLKGPPDYIEDDRPSLAYRNQAWMSQILSSFQSDRSFLAVGAGHLYGPKGLIQLLRDQGYNVSVYGKTSP